MPPAHWVNATGKFAVRDLDGSKVLVKLAENPFAFAKRCRVFFGGPATATTRFRPTCARSSAAGSAGTSASWRSGTNDVLSGSHERLELQPWQPETERTARVAFPWKPDTWYMMKLEVQSMGGGKVRARGKVWAKGQPEPAAWTIETLDPIGNLKGAPGLYADAPSARGGG